ncbi:VOC family protein [Ornithinimicrobium avium]|uniref:VOC family protein n=1 Tax=Ornithinimicrobium avium TaxID=2283195 RepID=A0A345NKY4_9MICO|nr:VOC family protein [Ornithinimicrobium avium]AXH95692.1 VOC family protein [Ornithinimicrobium avium]
MATLNPYLSFDGAAREAMTFYQSVFGGELTISTFGESGFTEGVPDLDQVMHAMLVTPAGFTLMAADTPDGVPHNPGDNISISLSGPAEDEDELRGFFARLSEDATPGVPLEKAPWGDHFGMLTDRFGIGWMVNIAGEPA